MHRLPTRGQFLPLETFALDVQEGAEADVIQEYDEACHKPPPINPYPFTTTSVTSPAVSRFDTMSLWIHSKPLDNAKQAATIRDT